MLYRHVVPGLVGRSGAVNAVVSDMKKNIGDMLSGEAFNIDPARIKPAMRNPGNGFGFGSPGPLRNLRFNMLPKYCTSMSILVLVFSLRGTECHRISSARKQPRRFGSLPAKESLSAITTRSIPAQRW